MNASEYVKDLYESGIGYEDARAEAAANGMANELTFRTLWREAQGLSSFL